MNSFFFLLSFFLSLYFSPLAIPISAAAVATVLAPSVHPPRAPIILTNASSTGEKDIAGARGNMCLVGHQGLLRPFHMLNCKNPKCKEPGCGAMKEREGVFAKTLTVADNLHRLVEKRHQFGVMAPTEPKKAQDTTQSMFEELLTAGVTSILSALQFCDSDLGAYITDTNFKPSGPTPLHWLHQLRTQGNNRGQKVDICLAIDCSHSVFNESGLLPTAFFEFSTSTNRENKEAQMFRYVVDLINHAIPLPLRGTLLGVNLQYDAECITEIKVVGYYLQSDAPFPDGGGSCPVAAPVLFKQKSPPVEVTARVLAVLMEHARNMGYAATKASGSQSSYVAVHGDFVYKRLPRVRESPKVATRCPEYNLRFIPGAEEYAVSEMLKLTVIRYPFIKGVHAAFCVLQCLRVVKQLYTLHSEGLCHGDVRLANIVFSESALASNTDGATAAASTTSLQAPSAQPTEPTANLIDFDLCALENSYYSGSYQQVIGADGQRHKDAQAEKAIKKSHDWFALAAAFGFHRLVRCSEQQQTKWTRALQDLEDGNINSALEHMSAIEDCQLSLPKDKKVDSFKGATGYTPEKPKAGCQASDSFCAGVKSIQLSEADEASLQPPK